VRQVASIKHRKDNKNFLVVFDGDQSKNVKAIKSNYINDLETFDDKAKEEEWLDSKIIFLPGQEWPEKWILLNSLKLVKELAVVNKCAPDELAEIIETALHADKHAEFYEMGERLNVQPEVLLDRISIVLTQELPDEFDLILTKVNSLLP
jgi:hypothetical protein